jgi:hypothetical protein
MSWIKIRTTLPSDPRVAHMAATLGRPTNEIVGALVTLWIFVDAQVGLLGFADALRGVGWLADAPKNGVSIPRFQEHNGSSAKARAQGATRQAKHRGVSA